MEEAAGSSASAPATSSSVSTVPQAVESPPADRQPRLRLEWQEAPEHSLTKSVAGRSRVVPEDVLLLPEPPKPSTTRPPDPPEHKAATAATTKDKDAAPAPASGDDHRVRLTTARRRPRRSSDGARRGPPTRCSCAPRCWSRSSAGTRARPPCTDQPATTPLVLGRRARIRGHCCPTVYVRSLWPTLDVVVAWGRTTELLEYVDNRRAPTHTACSACSSPASRTRTALGHRPPAIPVQTAYRGTCVVSAKNRT
jgi:hypothetical protein